MKKFLVVALMLLSTHARAEASAMNCLQESAEATRIPREIIISAVKTDFDFSVNTAGSVSACERIVNSAIRLHRVVGLEHGDIAMALRAYYERDDIRLTHFAHVLRTLTASQNR